MSEQKKKGMSIWGKLGIGCGGLIVLIIVIAVIAGGSSSTKTGSSSSKTPAKTEFAIGETISLKDHQIIINSFDGNYKSSNMFDKPQNSANSFVAVDVTVINSGSKDLSVNDFGFKLEDETGTQRMTTLIAGLDDQLQSVTLSAGGKTSGKLAFEAKKDSSKLILHYSGGFASGGEVTIKLK